MRKLLLATTNKHKLEEMRSYLETLPFDIITLEDINQDIEDPDEPFDVIEMNALRKAMYYAEKTQLMAIADDSGLFVDALDGWPGVKSARVAPDDESRRNLLLEKLHNVPDEKKTASFRTAIALYDPTDNSSHISLGITQGTILKKPIHNPDRSFTYDPIFFNSGIKKANSELSIEEKNRLSSRGKALHQMKYYLQKQYGHKHIVVPCALVIKNMKILMIKRNDPHRPEYHEKWEFPGGSVDFREQIIENVVRETKEETGLDVEPLTLLQHIAVEAQEFSTFAYQVYLIPYVCKVVGGEIDLRNEEALDAVWCTLDDVFEYDLVGENARFYEKLLPELKAYLKIHNE